MISFAFYGRVSTEDGTRDNLARFKGQNSISSVKTIFRADLPVGKAEYPICQRLEDGDQIIGGASLH